MFAVFKTGGKQYKVKSGDILSVEKLVADLGDKVRFNEVLALGGDKPSIGTPLINGACIEAEILNQTKGKKVIHFVKRRRKHSSQRKKGHRQDLTILKVLDIKSDQKINEEISFEILGKVSKEPKKITTKSKVATKEPEKSNIKSNENVSSSSSDKKNQKKSASTTPKPKKPVDKKALENNVNKEKLDNKSK
jgi:large subunit ribosomal protein L21|tara:strand:- start:383 stop:958 length:576 start_codon:yes stop_codon:yes gene_type:complete